MYEEDRPEDTIGNRIRPISDSLVSIKNPDELATRVKSVLSEGPVVPIPGFILCVSIHGENTRD